jgi:TonB family protein
MKRISHLSTAFQLTCLLLVLIIAAAEVRLAAQPPDDEQKAERLKAVEDAKQKIAKNPDDASEHYRLGRSYEKRSQWEAAVVAYSQAVTVKPDFAYAYYDLGWCYTRLNNYEEALKAHQEAKKHFRITSFKLRLAEEKVYYAIGWDLYRLRRYNEAIDHYVKAVQLDHKFQEAAYEIGRVCMAQGDQVCTSQIIDKLAPDFRDMLLKEMEIVDWIEKDGTITPNPLVHKMVKETQPTLLYKEKANYTVMAQDNNIQGVVILSVVFGANKKIGGVKIVRDLPYGLTAQALIAMQKIKFKPAMKDGKPISVRGNLEFSFYLY